jgi:hypothetical protein
MHGVELNTLLCDSNNIKLKRVERKWYNPPLCFGVASDYILVGSANLVGIIF